MSSEEDEHQNETEDTSPATPQQPPQPNTAQPEYQKITEQEAKAFLSTILTESSNLGDTYEVEEILLNDTRTVEPSAIISVKWTEAGRTPRIKRIGVSKWYLTVQDPRKLAARFQGYFPSVCTDWRFKYEPFSSEWDEVLNHIYALQQENPAFSGVSDLAREIVLKFIETNSSPALTQKHARDDGVKCWWEFEPDPDLSPKEHPLMLVPDVYLMGWARDAKLLEKTRWEGNDDTRCDEIEAYLNRVGIDKAFIFLPVEDLTGESTKSERVWRFPSLDQMSTTHLV